jgi:endonuclease/exonuclease/phosphatase family metal-dependent hydrolase
MNARARFPQLAGLVEATAVFLFFYQALRVLFSVLFGLIYDALFAETASMTTVGLVLVVVILALLTPLAAPRQPERRRIALLASAVLVFLARIPLTPNDPQSRLVASILIVAGTGVYLVSRLRDGPRDVVRALILALVVDQLLRAAGHTWDVTLRAGWLWGQAIVSLGLCLLAGWRFRRSLNARQRSKRHNSDTRAGLGFSAGILWHGWLFLETSLLNFPNAMARWGYEDYSAFALTLPFVLALAFLGDDHWRTRRGWIDGLGFSGILLLGLALAHLLRGTGATISLLTAQVTSLVLVFSCFLSSPDGREDRLGPGLALGGILFLIMSFAYAFAFTYAYTLDLFRGMGLPIFLAVGLLTGLPVLRLPKVTTPASRTSRARFLSVFGIGDALMVLVLVMILPFWHPLSRARDSLHLATYNIHYGYDTDWHLSLEKQAETIEASGADVVMLQEVDTGRPTSYMIDDALWLSQRLGMEVVYLPTVEHLTGIALLTRYPILNSETLLLPSELEQTGIIWAELDVDGTSLNAFATWLGLEPEERARQLDAALPFIAAHPGPAAFGGDFNSTPDSPVYARIRDAGFTDPFVALDLGSPPTDPAINPTKRIDFVWLRGLEPLDAQVLDSLASDHRAVVVKAALTE